MVKDDMTKISFRISNEEKEQLIKYAAENDLTISQVIRRAVKMYLKQNESEE